MVGVPAVVASSRCVVANVKIRILSLSSCGCPIMSREAVDAGCPIPGRFQCQVGWFEKPLVKGVPSLVKGTGIR